MDPPTRHSSTSTQLTLDWTAPSSEGGCSVTGYAVFRDDGSAGAVSTEVNTGSDTNVRDKPTLRSMLITNFPADGMGKTFTFQI